ncbi:MAG: hypothetical protein IT258_14235 [Saprospiraceae bacterium]|nr:hypothetical protein [Saprospiraceae bacterium]
MNRSPFNNDAAEQLYRLVVEYDRRGDVYNAVKLCKRLARMAPDWSVPFAFLSRTYRSRMEWKPTFHYCLRAVEHNAFDENLWETLGIAATALAEWETARYAWNQLGFHFKPSKEALNLDLGIIPLRLNPLTQPEVVAARRIDPVRAVIESIPQPSSGRRYGDLVLMENKPQAQLYQQHKTLPIHDELQLLKSSNWHTFSVLLYTDSAADVDALANLCLSASLGFDNWSHATRFFQPNLHRNVAEYFDQAIFGKMEREVFLVAMSAKQQNEVEHLLETWRVITLRECGQVEQLL